MTVLFVFFSRGLSPFLCVCAASVKPEAAPYVPGRVRRSADLSAAALAGAFFDAKNV
jgi:hypothetical protein